MVKIDRYHRWYLVENFADDAACDGASRVLTPFRGRNGQEADVKLYGRRAWVVRS